MSDTVQPTAPQARPRLSHAEATARLLGQRTAPGATPDAPQGAQATAPTAAVAELAPAPDQDTPEGTLPDEAASGDPDAGQPPEQEADPDPVVFHAKDGTPVTRSEAERGFLRQQDYSRKTEELARARDTHLGEIEQFSQLRNAAAQVAMEHLPQLDESLRHTDPASYLLQKDARDSALRRIQELAAGAEQDRQRAEAIRIERERERLPQVIPSWQDPAIAEEERAMLAGYLGKAGLTEAEGRLVVSHAGLVKLALAAAKLERVREGGAKGGQATAAARKAQPSLSPSQVTPPAPAARAARERSAVVEQLRGAKSRRERQALGARLLG